MSRPKTLKSSQLRLVFAIGGRFDLKAGVPRPNRYLIYFGACIIAGLRLARERQVHVRVTPTIAAINESVDLSREIFNRVFRRVPGAIIKKNGIN